MSSPPLRGTAEWSAKREVALLLGLAGGNRHAAQQLWLRKERIKAEASQFASAGAPQASQQPAGCRAKPAPARAQAVPKQKTAAQLARSERSREQALPEAPRQGGEGAPEAAGVAAPRQG